jgi:hypothetical protein
VKILFAGEQGWTNVVLRNPSLYVMLLWNLDHIDKTDPAIWAELDCSTMETP